jgi:muramoyltetrapeptide carboxypeptidase LdcA involved in peptidoglycan recycling
LGLIAEPTPHALDAPELLAADPEARADDLHAALVDPDVRGIISTIGGDDSIRILPFLDLDLISAHPKVFLGFSDSSITHMAYLRAGVHSFYGPSIMAGFAENRGMHAYTRDGVRTMAMTAEAPTTWPENSQGWTVEHLDWADPRNQSRRRDLRLHAERRWLGGEPAEGALVVSCLEVLDWLRGTEWWPDLDGAVLAVETSEEQPSPEVVASFLRSLAAMGDLDELHAILFARPGGADLDPEAHRRYDDAILSVVRDEEHLDRLPIVTGLDFGHTDPMWTLPMGVPTRIDPVSRTIQFLDAGVSQGK